MAEVPAWGVGQRQRAVLAAASAALLVAAVIAVAAMGGDAGAQQSPVLLGGTGAKLDWSAFDQQLHSDWVRRKAAHKHGESSADAALRERKEADERRMLAQKRLEVQCACLSPGCRTPNASFSCSFKCVSPPRRCAGEEGRGGEGDGEAGAQH